MFSLFLSSTQHQEEKLMSQCGGLFELEVDQCWVEVLLQSLGDGQHIVWVHFWKARLPRIHYFCGLFFAVRIQRPHNYKPPTLVSPPSLIWKANVRPYYFSILYSNNGRMRRSLYLQCRSDVSKTQVAI